MDEESKKISESALLEEEDGDGGVEGGANVIISGSATC